MGFALAPIIVFTVLWVVVGIVLPFIVPKGPNRGCVYKSYVLMLKYDIDPQGCMFQ
jgi:hypothetical protein